MYRSLLSFLALLLAVSIDTCRALQYELTDFKAACKPKSDCYYDITVDVDGLGQSSLATAKNVDGMLPEISHEQVGTYQLSVTKGKDGSLIMEIFSKYGVGTHTISSDELKTSTSEGEKVQSYVGPQNFNITIGAAGTSSGSVSIASSSSTATSTASSTSTAASTSSSGESATTGDAAKQTDDSDDTGDALRDRVPAPFIMACGLAVLFACM